jgi:hypothetical protein
MIFTKQSTKSIDKHYKKTVAGIDFEFQIKKSSNAK